MEQISPFPYEMLLHDLEDYKNASVHWVQEEHKNQGWWAYVRPRVMHVMKLVHEKNPDFNKHINYYGRPPSSITATSKYKDFLKEKEIFLSDAVCIV